MLLRLFLKFLTRSFIHNTRSAYSLFRTDFSSSIFFSYFTFILFSFHYQFTDIKTAAAFTKDVKEVGYGTMRINNYRKNGEVFNASITVFPIYDSVIAGEVPVLTHFATLLNDVR